ncbi:hypothetical protein BED46_028390 [Burkholderia contaminans]|nr:hypothetical protein BGI28_19715 [Burkholderia contaminans]OMI75562.1 hypothetical protein BED46_028390 [Burkholderia contaminans]
MPRVAANFLCNLSTYRSLQLGRALLARLKSALGQIQIEFQLSHLLGQLGVFSREPVATSSFLLQPLFVLLI